MNTDKWSRYFESRKCEDRYIPWQEPLPEDDPGFEAMRSMLRQLQAGEGAEGKMGEALAHQTPDLGYARCLRAYAGEERTHGLLLDMLCQRYGVVPTQQADLVIRALVRLVNLGPLMMRVLMLYTAEIVAVVMYERLRTATPDRVVKSVLTSILADERGHIAFHGDRLRSVLRTAPSWEQGLYIFGHRLGFGLVSGLLYLENRPVFKAYGLDSFSGFLEECRELRDRSATGVLSVFRGRSSGPTVPGERTAEPAGW